MGILFVCLWGIVACEFVLVGMAAWAAVTPDDLQDLMRSRGSNDPWTSTRRWARSKPGPQEGKP